MVKCSLVVLGSITVVASSNGQHPQPSRRVPVKQCEVRTHNVE